MATTSGTSARRTRRLPSIRSTTSEKPMPATANLVAAKASGSQPLNAYLVVA